MSRGMSRVAVTIGARVRARPTSSQDDDEQSLALRYAEASRELTPLLGPVLEHVAGGPAAQPDRARRRSTAPRWQTGRPARARRRSRSASPTSWTSPSSARASTPAELGAVADAAGGAGERRRRAAGAPGQDDRRRGDAPVRATPTRCSTPRWRCVDAADAEGEDFPQLRAGVARGEALARAGDWFGRPVNLASRITDIARPGSSCSPTARSRRRDRGRLLPLLVRRQARAQGRERTRELFRAAPRAPATSPDERGRLGRGAALAEAGGLAQRVGLVGAAPR